jgi:hypothetical protein
VVGAEVAAVEINHFPDAPGSPGSPGSPNSRPASRGSRPGSRGSAIPEGSPEPPLGSPEGAGSPAGSPKTTTKKKKKSKRKRGSTKKGKLSMSSIFRVAFQTHDLERATWAAVVVQNAVRSMFGRKLYALAKRLRANHIRDLERGRLATKLQKRWRERQARRLLIEKYRTVVVKYIDPVTEKPYWHNPKSQQTVWVKPKILVEENIDVRLEVKLPFPDVEFANKCLNCSDRVLSKWCQQCDEMFCNKCCDELHHHGKKTKHHRISFDVCVECEYQTASRICKCFFFLLL